MKNADRLRKAGQTDQFYEELGKAAILSHEQLYEVATGRVAPFSDIPEYLPKLY